MYMRRTDFAAACRASHGARVCIDRLSEPSAPAPADAWIDDRSIVSRNVGSGGRWGPLQISTAPQDQGRDGRVIVLSDHAGPPSRKRPLPSLTKVCPAWSTPAIPRIRKRRFPGLSAQPVRGLPRVLLTAVLVVTLIGGGAPLLAQPTPESTPASRPTSDPLLAGLSRWDADSDGILTCEEWKRYVEQLFTRSDKNRDGGLDRTEFATLGKYEPVFSKADFAYFDDNADGKIGIREFADKPNPLFARYDRNRDCRLTADEIHGRGTSSGPPDGPSGRQQKPPPGGVDRNGTHGIP